MRFYQIVPNRRSKDQIDYAIRLFSFQLPKKEIPTFVNKNTLALYLSLDNCVELQYYSFVDRSPVQIRYYGHCQINAATPTTISRAVEIVNSLEDLDIKTVLKMVTKGGWQQVFYDYRSYSFFFEDTMPGADQAHYGFEIKSSCGDLTHSEFMTMYAESDVAARQKVLTYFPTRAKAIKDDPYYYKFYDSLIKNFGEWLSNGMPYYTRDTVTPENFSWSFDQVFARHLLELVTPQPQPELVETQAEEGQNV